MSEDVRTSQPLVKGSTEYTLYTDDDSQHRWVHDSEFLKKMGGAEGRVNCVC